MNVWDQAGRIVAFLRPSEDPANPGWIAKDSYGDNAYVAEYPEEAWNGLQKQVGAALCPGDKYTKNYVK